ncbi:protein kinase domain-containing protein [Streptomyces sp. NRRL WC-3742]|uniref:protein kinase domain-containing protein n=1 Tax=Streptomyces sp. NRRL WC-3742 TaxID=1463934 RepID=UPI00099CA3BE|nr:protein kinase [Streptomyces sp. NRRL WC-3742]
MGESLQPGDPRQLGGYYLDGRLGAGGQGVVYEGYDAHGRRVAVKVLRAVDEEDRARLRREIHAWRKVEPYCTTRVLEADLDGAVPYVVSEYVAGPDLRRAVNSSRPYGPEELRRLAVGLAAALVAIHRAGVVHRDLKPENILLGPDGPRVIDFGIARILEGTATTGLPMGTLRYMPPERYRGKPGDGKVDVWGWAAVVLFAATGYDAFQGESLGAVADRVATYDPDTSRLEQPLRSLVTAALAKDARQRPSAEQLLLSLVGRADLAAAVRETAPGGPPRDAPPSRAQVAEAVFAALGAPEQQAVPSILLRLVAPGERAEDTLRSARRLELGNDLVPEQVTEQVLEVFTRAGVLVWEDGSATLATAALIRAWPRLRDWVAGERAGLAVHQRLAEASRTWSDHGRKRSDLLQGTPLTQAQSWAATGRFHLVLNEVERAFLDACAALTRRRGRLRVVLSGVLALLLVVATGAAVVAFQQRNTLAEQRDRATSAQVAGTAMSLRTSDPQLARRLSVAAAKLSDTPESWNALMTTAYQPEQDAFRLPDYRPTTAELDGSGRLLVAAEGTRVDVWDLNSRTRSASWTAPTAVHQVTVSEDGTTVAVAGDDEIVHLLDISHGAPAPTGANFSAPHQSNGYWSQVALSPHGNYLLVDIVTDAPKPDEGSRENLTVFDAHTANKIGDVSAPISVFLLMGTSFSPDEKVVSFPVPRDGKPFLWDTLPDKKPVPFPDIEVEAKDISGPVVFSPDGKRAAVATKSGEVSVFYREGGYPRRLKGSDNIAATDYPVSFSHDGDFVTWGGTMWAICASEKRECALPPPAPVLRMPSTEGECSPRTAYRFTADDTALECIGTDRVVRRLGVGALTRPPQPTPAFSQNSTVSRDRTTLALSTERGFDLWSLTAHTKRFSVDAKDCGASPYRLSADGKRLAAQCHEVVKVWDLSTDGHPLLASLPLPLSTRTGVLSDTMVALAFSPDGASLAVEQAQDDGTTTLTFWEPSTQRQIHTVKQQAGYPRNGLRLHFNPDGRSVYAAPGIGAVAFPSGEVLVKGSTDFEPDAVSDDGSTLYAYPQGYLPYLRAWDARTLQPKDDLRTGPGSQSLLDHSTDGAVSADGRLFALIQNTDSYRVQVWDTTHRLQLGVPLTGPLHDLVGVSFAPDGTGVTAVDAYGTFFTYPIAPALLVHDLCDRAGALTEEEWKRYIPDVPYRPSC